MGDLKWPPQAGWIVLCYFPHEEKLNSPGPKARPAVIIEVHEDKRVTVAYGTTQETSEKAPRREVSPYEVEIDPNKQDHACAKIKYQTRFDFTKIISLQYESKWFPCVEATASPHIGSLPETLRATAKEAKKRAEDMLAKKPVLRFGFQPSRPKIIFVKKKSKPPRTGGQNAESENNT